MVIPTRTLGSRDLDVPNLRIADQKYESFEKNVRLENCEQNWLKIDPLGYKPWLLKT